MTDDSYPDDWSTEPPHPFDPVLGDELDRWRPTPAQRAAVIELVLAYCAREHLFAAELMDFTADRHQDLQWTQALLALLDLFQTTAIGSQGLELTLARLHGDLDSAHDTMHGGI